MKYQREDVAQLIVHTESALMSAAIISQSETTAENNSTHARDGDDALHGFSAAGRSDARFETEICASEASAKNDAVKATVVEGDGEGRYACKRMC